MASAMKIGVSSYSYSRLVSNGTMAQSDVPAAARKMGFDFLEFSTISVPKGTTLESCAKILRAECECAGMPVLNYTIGANFLTAPGSWQAEVERLRGELQIARILGASGMRHDATGGFPREHQGARGFDDALPTLVKGCRAVTEIAADMGIRTMVENHGFFCQDSDRVEKLANGVSHPNFGLLVDLGNFLCADDDPARAVGRVAAHAFHVHAKDFHVKPGTAPDPGAGWFRSRAGNFLRGAIIGHGDVPVVQCLRVLKNAGYAGALSIEFEGMEDPMTGISVGRENLVRYAAGV
jgi:sugar phosphate isomerase/epimerase